MPPIPGPIAPRIVAEWSAIMNLWKEQGPERLSEDQWKIMQADTKSGTFGGTSACKRCLQHHEEWCQLDAQLKNSMTFRRHCYQLLTSSRQESGQDVPFRAWWDLRAYHKWFRANVDDTVSDIEIEGYRTAKAARAKRKRVDKILAAASAQALKSQASHESGHPQKSKSTAEPSKKPKPDPDDMSSKQPKAKSKAKTASKAASKTASKTASKSASKSDPKNASKSTSKNASKPISKTPSKALTRKSSHKSVKAPPSDSSDSDSEPDDATSEDDDGEDLLTSEQIRAIGNLPIPEQVSIIKAAPVSHQVQLVDKLPHLRRFGPEATVEKLERDIERSEAYARGFADGQASSKLH